MIDDGSHDDLIILEEAKMAGGFVISNDKFRDHSERLSNNFLLCFQTHIWFLRAVGWV